MLWGWGVFLWVGGQGYLACVLANLEPMNLEPLVVVGGVPKLR